MFNVIKTLSKKQHFQLIPLSEWYLSSGCESLRYSKFLLILEIWFTNWKRSMKTDQNGSWLQLNIHAYLQLVCNYFLSKSSTKFSEFIVESYVCMCITIRINVLTVFTLNISKLCKILQLSPWQWHFFLVNWFHWPIF